MKLSLTILLGLSCIAIASANAATITLDTKLTTTGGTSSSLYEEFHPSKLNPLLAYDNSITMPSTGTPFSFSSNLSEMYSSGTVESFKLNSLSLIGAKLTGDVANTFTITYSVNGNEPITVSNITTTLSFIGDTQAFAYLNFDLSSLNLQLNTNDKISWTITPETENTTANFNPIIVTPDNNKSTITGSNWGEIDNCSPIIRINGEAIPEPSTTALAGLGLASLLLRRRRKS